MNNTDITSSNNSCVVLQPTIEDISWGFAPSTTALFATIYGILSFVAVFGNLLIIIAFYKSAEIREKHFNTYILCLAVADFLVGCLAVPVRMIILLRGMKSQRVPTTLTILYLSTYCLYFVSALVTVLMSYDRYLLMKDVLIYTKKMSRKRTTLTLITACFCGCGVALCLLVLYHTSVSYSRSCSRFFLSRLSGFLNFILLFLFPFVCLICLNSIIFYKLKGRLAYFKHTNGSAGPKGLESDQKSLSYLNGEIPVLRGTEGNLAVKGVSNKQQYVTASSLHSPSMLSGLTGIPRFKTRPEICETVRNASSNEKESARLRKLIKAGKQLFLIVAVFLICWLPYQFLLLVGGFIGWEWDGKEIWVYAFHGMLYANSAVNPVLYIITSERYKHQVSLMLCRKYR